MFWKYTKRDAKQVTGRDKSASVRFGSVHGDEAIDRSRHIFRGNSSEQHITVSGSGDGGGSTGLNGEQESLVVDVISDPQA
ncbi:hypothetical protein PFLUV_G00262020 [Perca fluviatilis]|uniref:Uncharacterized protein n=1 Tax=Perca fluviatilis TaxID=8168 RepID=A0A6A5E8B6_PERFL|nr:hypothetical protein PFLUV_G00262020 [Perca fluviatilis]